MTCDDTGCDGHGSAGGGRCTYDVFERRVWEEMIVLISCLSVIVTRGWVSQKPDNFVDVICPLPLGAALLCILHFHVGLRVGPVTTFTINYF